MKIIAILGSLILLGIVGFLCSFFIVANIYKEDLWEAIQEKEEDDDRGN